MEASKLEKLNKKIQEQSKLNEEKRISKLEELKLNELEKLTPKEEIIKKFESFEVDDNKKNQLKNKIQNLKTN